MSAVLSRRLVVVLLGPTQRLPLSLALGSWQGPPGLGYGCGVGQRQGLALPWCFALPGGDTVGSLGWRCGSWYGPLAQGTIPLL